jgi:non-canonical poly(A) RNA polymerase PAPD5/7
LTDSSFRLHKEICDFYEFVKPRPFEVTARRELVERIQKTIRAWGGGNEHARDCEVHCFGSFASGLYLPTADMDLVAISKSFASGGSRELGQSPDDLRSLTRHIMKLGIAKPGTATCITRSKVPIVKFTDKRTGIKVDISFENDTGFPAIKTFEAWKKQYPALEVLVAVVKQFLVMRGINEVFSGGIGGFTTICLVTHILQIMPEIQSGAMDPQQHYGEIFMKILDFYGNKIDIRSSGILMYPPYHYDKDKHPRTTQNKDRLTIIDPNNPNNDISGGSHKIDVVFGRFRTAFSDLQRYMSQLRQGHIKVASILECILGGNYQQVDQQRERLRSNYLHVDPRSVPALPPAPTIPPGVKDAPAPRAQRPKKKPRAQGQYAPSTHNAVPSAPTYVAPMVDAPMYAGAGGYNGVYPSPHSSHPAYPPPTSFSNHFPNQYDNPTYYSQRLFYDAQHRSNHYIPPPPSYPPPWDTPPPPPPPPPPSTPPPPHTREPEPPLSPDSSAPMDISDQESADNNQDECHRVTTT